MKIVLYTHTDCKDVWSIYFGQTNKYLKDYEKIVFVNKHDNAIPKDYQVCLYKEESSYTERMVQCIEQVGEGVILFQHEDMFLYDTPLHEKLKEYSSLIESDEVDFVKLLRGAEGIEHPIKDTVFLNPPNSPYGFVIQPTICKASKILELFKKVGKTNIWDFEGVGKRLGFKVAFSYMGENKRGRFHWNSFVYPFIATAIVKGKWNYSEYKKELDLLFSEYKINKNLRGCR